MSQVSCHRRTVQDKQRRVNAKGGQERTRAPVAFQGRIQLTNIVFGYISGGHLARLAARQDV